MATETLNPLSVGGTDNWTNLGGANKVASTTLPDDEDTTYIHSNNPGVLTTQIMNMSAPVAINVKTDYIIGNSSFVARRKQVSGSAVSNTFTLKGEFSVAGSTTQQSSTPTGSWVNTSVTVGSVGAAGFQTLAKLSSARFTVTSQATATGSIGVTSFSVVITYTPGLWLYKYNQIKSDMVSGGIKVGGRL